MIRCSGCNAVLPDTAVRCQFCGCVLKAPPTVRLDSRPPAKRSFLAPGAPPWAGTAYNLISLYWILSGGYQFVSALLISSDKGPDYVGAVAGLLPIVVGLGLLLRLNIIRGIVNFLCALQILGGILGVIVSFFAGDPVQLIMALVQIGTSGFMIYLIGETDTGPPNL